MTTTMNVAHTPGPWNYNPGGVFCGFGTICTLAVGGSTGNDPNAAAVGATAISNARLIAAAPDMLAALEECITDEGAQCIVTSDVAYMIRRFKAINAIARAAIRKAERGGM